LTNKGDLNIILSLINEYDIKKLEAYIENKLGNHSLRFVSRDKRSL
jgi:hypothetical protein